MKSEGVGFSRWGFRECILVWARQVGIVSALWVEVAWNYKKGLVSFESITKETCLRPLWIEVAWNYKKGLVSFESITKETCLRSI